jgi:hypothetical protein
MILSRHPGKREPVMASASTIDRAWISSEFVKQIDAERSMAADAKSRAESPPDPSLSVLYHEIAAADERHVLALEKIATRYGHTPSRSEGGGGVAEALGRLKDKVTGLGSTHRDVLEQDLAAKSNAVNLRTAWAHAFESLGDSESARELSAVVAEDQAHRDALLEGLKRMLEQAARGEAEAGQAKAS